MFEGTIHMITAGVLVTDPLAVRVDVGRIGMSRCVTKIGARFAIPLLSVGLVLRSFALALRCGLRLRRGRALVLWLLVSVLVSARWWAVRRDVATADTTVAVLLATLFATLAFFLSVDWDNQR
jgi:hypothetical protein